MESNAAILIHGDYIQGAIRMSITEYNKVFPSFTVQSLDVFPEYVKRDHHGNFECLQDSEYLKSQIVFKERKTFDLMDINEIIKELTEIKERMEAMEVAENLSE